MSRNVRRFLYLNIGLCLFALVIFAFTRLALDEKSRAFCFFKAFFHLYCPFCGGTRTAAALFRFDILSALRYNAYLTFIAFFTLFYDLKVFFSLLLKKSRPFYLPKWVWWSLLWLLLAFFLARNALLFLGFDPAGDLLR